MEGLTRAQLHAVADKGFVGGCRLAAQYLVAAVSCVCEEGVSDMAHVGAYLMGASCLEAAFEEGDGSVAFEDVPVCDCGLAGVATVGVDGHAEAVLGVTGYVAAYGALVLGERSPYEGVVCAVCGVVEELLAEVGLGLGGLGYDEEAAGILVYTVDETYLGVAGVVARIVPEVPGEGIDEGAGIIAASGVYDHAGRLVDDEEDVVLVGDVQGDVLGDYVPFTAWPVEHEGDGVSGLDLVVASDGDAVGLYVACLGGFLYAVAAGITKVVHEETVDTDGVLAAVGNDAAVFVELAGKGLWHELVVGDVVEVLCIVVFYHSQSSVSIMSKCCASAALSSAMSSSSGSVLPTTRIRGASTGILSPL